jgi:hypothetical protein
MVFEQERAHDAMAAPAPPRPPGEGTLRNSANVDFSRLEVPEMPEFRVALADYRAQADNQLSFLKVLALHC